MAAGILAACSGADDGSADPAPSTTQSAASSSAPEAPETSAAPSDPQPESAPAESAPATPAPSASSAPPADVPEALGFSAPLVGGGDIELAALAGRPVLLWFWSPF